MILLTIAIFILILGLLVFVHELGHFVMAKRAGMRVDEFGFGFPPRIFGFKKGETLYSINLIPLGGFVKILGEDGSEDADPRSFGNKSGWQRFAVLIAGVTMNMILAWGLLSLGMGLGLPAVINQGENVPGNARVSELSVGILGVSPHSPAQQAGIKPGDLIVAINGEPVETLEEVQALTAQAAGTEANYTVKRGADSLDLAITPRVNPPEGEGALGISLGEIGRVSYPWYEAIYRGFLATFNIFWLTLSAFWGLLVQLFQGNPSAADLSGPVGIAVLTRDVTRLGFVYLLQFTALLSVNLAILNAIPFPALDGGRVLFLAIEKIRGRKLPVHIEQAVNSIGFLLLILLMVVVTVKDFGKFDILGKLGNLF